MAELLANTYSRSYLEQQIGGGAQLSDVLMALHNSEYYPGIRGVSNRSLSGSVYHADIPRSLAINGQKLPPEAKNSKTGQDQFLLGVLTGEQANLLRWYYDQRLYYTGEDLLQEAIVKQGTFANLMKIDAMWPTQTPHDVEVGAEENIYVSPHDGKLRLRSTRRIRGLSFLDGRKEIACRTLFGYVVQQLEFVDNQGFRFERLDFVGERNFAGLTAAAVLNDAGGVKDALTQIRKAKPIGQADSIRYATIFRNIHTKHICMDELNKVRADFSVWKKERIEKVTSWMGQSGRIKPTLSYTYLDKNSIQRYPLQEWLEQCVDAYEDPSYVQMSEGRKKSWNQHVRKAFEEVYYPRGLHVDRNPLLTWQQHVFYPKELESAYRGAIRTPGHRV